IGGGDGGGDEWEEIEVEEDDGMPDMQMMWAMMQGQGGGGGKRTIKKRVKKEKKGLSSAMVAQTVLSLAKESINLDNLELFDDSALMDSGMDSLTAVSFRNSVQSALNLKMPASLMFDYPTIKEITSHIVEIGGGDGGGESEYEEIDVEVDDGMGMMMPPWAMMGAGGGKRKVKKMVKKEKKGLSSAMVAQTVLSLAKESINLDNLELFDDSALMDSGMDSLTAVSFRNSVQSALNLKMPASLMFDYPTIKEITSHIVEIGGGDGGGDEWEEIEVEEDDGMPDMQMMWAMMQGQGGGGGKRTIKKRVKKEKKGLSSAMVAQTVLSLAKESINLDNLELFDDSALMDSGMDSLTAVSFRNSVQSALNLKMPASLMFDYPTIKEITSHIVEIGGGDGGGESEYEEIDVEVDDGMGGMGMMPPPEWFIAQQGAMPAAAASGEPAAAQEKAKPKGLDASMVMQTVRDMALQAIQLDDQKLDEDSPLMDSGMDSLTSVSFRNSLQSALGMKVPASLMFDYPTMKDRG
ncbi:unnamed protein product, partial [Prorocentrum cordatum]